MTTPTENEIAAYRARLSNRAVAEKNLLDAQKQGISVNGITLASGEYDRSLFAQGLILLREAENLQPDEAARGAFRASMQTIADAQGVTHTMSVTDLRALLVAYGASYQALWTATAQAAI